MNARWNGALAATFAALVGVEARGQDEAKPAETPQPRVARTTAMVGVPVMGAEGEKIGELKDLVIDDDHDCVLFGIVSAPGDKLLAVPFLTLRRSGSDGAGSFVVATPEVAKAPRFERDHWPVFDRDYAKKVYDFYKATPCWSDAPVAEASVADDPERAQPAVKAKEREEKFRTCRLTKSVGQDVPDAHEKRIGELTDVVVDESSGRVAYAVLSTGGFLGVGEKLMALPWASLQLPAADGKPRVLDATREQIEKAPSFDKKSWPDLSDRKWGTELHRYWNQTPYWEVRTDARAESHDVARHE